MSRRLRIEYPGASPTHLRQGYGETSVMNRGGQREDLFKDDDDRQKLLSTLGEACVKTEWQAQACSGTMTLESIAPRLHLGSWTCVSNLLNAPPQPQPQTQEVLPLCQ